MRGRRHKLQVSTFPFLAVLLCAMGSLILVLLVMDRKAHKLARARAEHEAARLAEEAAQSQAARRAEAEQKRRQAAADWERKRDALHANLTREQTELEIQMRKVRDQLTEIAARLRYESDTGTQLRHKVQDERGRLREEERLLATLRGTAGQAAAQSQESSQALRRMTIDLLRMEQALKDLRAARQREQRTFSVVPYHGRRGENRRPIYVECTAAGVIFHPERRSMPVFSREFLLGRGEPGGAPPDDVRAEVERRIARQRTKQPGAADATPYLLLLVRPDGIGTYCQFQAVLKDLTLDFGYEFIDADWVLDFPADEDQPSAQPWMTAAKTPAPAAPVTPPANATTPRPVALSQQRPAASGVSVQGFRTGEGPGSGHWPGGPSGQAGSGPFAPGGVPGGGPSAPSGVSFAGPGIGSPGTGAGGNSAGRGSGLTVGLGPNQPGQLVAQAPSLFGQGGGSSPSLGTSAGGGGAGPGPAGRGFGPSSVGGGRGHPAAMPPALGNDGGEPGTSDPEGSPGGGYDPTGGYVLRRSGGGSGSGSPMAGSSGSYGPGVPGLGPPRALASGDSPGTGHPGNGSPGNSYSGNGVPGAGSPGSGIPGNNSSGTGHPGGEFPGTEPSGSGSPRGSVAGAQGIGSPGSPGVRASGNGSSGANPPGGGFPGTGASGNGSTGGSVAGAQGIGNSGSPGAGISGNDSSGANPPGGGSPGTGPSGGGSAGGSVAGTSGVGSPGSPGSATPGPYSPGSPVSPDGRYAVARGNGADGPVQPAGPGGMPPGTAGAVPPGTPGATGQGGPGGTSAGTAGASPSGQPGAMGNSPGNGTSSSPGGDGSAAYPAVDPLLPRPPPGSQPTQRPLDQPPPERSPNDVPPQGAPRRRLLGGGGGGSGERGDPALAGLNRFAPPAAPVPQTRKPVALRPAWVHGGRDWTIYVECRSDGVVLYPSQRSFPLAQAAAEAAGNPLVTAIRQMIDRRQSARRPGEPPYYPKVCLLVRPEHVRTFLMVYPALEALPAPKMRRNLDPEDSVDDIVRGVNP